MKPFLIELFQDSALGSLLHTYRWAWPIAEVFHFVGLALLVGAIGMLDLRMLGFAKGLTLASVHRLVPIGIVGFVFNLGSGLAFISADPEQFLNNWLFQLKMLLIVIAGLNALAFYIMVFRRTEVLKSGDDAPVLGKVIACSSLLLWTGVIIVGRLMAFI